MGNIRQRMWDRGGAVAGPGRDHGGTVVGAWRDQAGQMDQVGYCTPLEPVLRTEPDEVEEDGGTLVVHNVINPFTLRKSRV